MTSAHLDGQATATGDAYRALLAVSAATVSHRDLPSLFHELAALLHQVVHVDSLALFLHDAAVRTCLAAVHRRGAEVIAAACLMKAVVAEITRAPVQTSAAAHKWRVSLAWSAVFRAAELSIFGLVVWHWLFAADRPPWRAVSLVAVQAVAALVGVAWYLPRARIELPVIQTSGLAPLRSEVPTA